MLIYDVLHKEKVHEAIANELRGIGLKCRPKKFACCEQKPFIVASSSKNDRKKIFKVDLSYQSLEVVNLSSGGIVHVPAFVSLVVDILEKNLHHEGIFRKAGSNVRQRELIAKIDSCGNFGDKPFGAIDLANCLKTFLRELPEPLIPYSFHDLLVRCTILKQHRDHAILLVCLLLPPHHLNTLAYICDFLKKVAGMEKLNKMSIENLAKVIGPNIMPLKETTMAAMHTRLNAHLLIVKILIENAEKIGTLPDSAAVLLSTESLGSVDNELNDSDSSNNLKLRKLKKKHRSGSLTRMFNGLRKIVGKSGSPTEESQPVLSQQVSSSDIESHQTPLLKSAKKRKMGQTELAVAQQAKKKRISDKVDKSKKMRLSLDRFVSRSKQKITDLDSEVSKTSWSPIDRRWSWGSNPSNSKKKRKDQHNRLSLVRLLTRDDEASRREQEEKQFVDDVLMEADVNLSDDGSGEQVSRKKSNASQYETRSKARRALDDNFDRQKFEGIDPRPTNNQEYVKVLKSEYEEIKSRVSAIETRISQEFGCISNEASQVLSAHAACKVESEYKKTLEEANSVEGNMITDNLAKRLKKDLKIRRSSEHKIIRSPSARKIGSIRRRSQEKLVRNPSSRRVKRSSSWHQNSESSTLMNSNSNNVYSSSTVTSFQPVIVYSNAPKQTEQRDVDSFCSSETNARLDYLQEQLHQLISHTVEHTREPFDDTISEDNSGRVSSLHGNEYSENLQYYNKRVQELKRSNSKTPSKDVLQHTVRFNEQTPPQVSRDPTINWRDAEGYLSNNRGSCTPLVQTGRASVAMLRTQNAGMVLAKAKLFDDGRRDSQKSAKSGQMSGKSSRRTHSESPKNTTTGSSSAIKTRSHSGKRTEESGDMVVRHYKENRHRLSPVQQAKSQTTILQENDLNVNSPRTNSALCKTPHIKKPLNPSAKTPKSARSLMRKQGIDLKRTPMKAMSSLPLTTPKRQSPRNLLKNRHLSRRMS